MKLKELLMAQTKLKEKKKTDVAELKTVELNALTPFEGSTSKENALGVVMRLAMVVNVAVDIKVKNLDQVSLENVVLRVVKIHYTNVSLKSVDLLIFSKSSIQLLT